MTLNNHLIAIYHSALEFAEPSAPLSEQVVLPILVARDRIDQRNQFSAAEFQEIRTLDARLRALARRIANEIPHSSVTEWRDTSATRSAAWWWNLDTSALTNESGLWSLATAAVAVSTLALLTTITSRFFDGGPDTLGAFAVVFQAVLTIVAGAGAADFASGRVNAVLARLGVAPTLYLRARLLFALLVFALVLGVRLSLPLIARLYNQWGVEARTRGEYSKAIEDYSRAVALKPDFAAAQYSLGEAYEHSLDYDKAIASYQGAIRGDSKLDLAYNNLARLQILGKQNYTGALQLLSSALELKPPENDVQFHIRKNRAWANLGLKNYREAEADAARASALRPESAAPYCLLAQIRDAQSDAAGARTNSIQCLSKPDKSDVEPYWLDFASERVNK